MQSVQGFLRVFIISLCVGGEARLAFSDPAVYEVGSDPALGFNLISWWNFDNSSTPNVDEGVAVWQNAVQSLYDAGFREVSISPVRYFDTTTFSIAPTSGQGPLLTSIDAGVAKAKQLGMRVTINPFVEPSGSSIWRGTYDPTGTAATTFWNDYQNYMIDVAQIAQAHNVDAMTIGTELKAMNDDANNASHWSSVIDAVSGTYHGPLGYSANWDDYRNTNLTSAIWQNPKISFIGIDSYFNNLLYDYFKYQNPSLTTTQITTMVNNATNPIQSYPDQSFIDLMTAAWKKMLTIDSPTVSSGGHTYFNLDGILPFAASLGKKVQFTEQGYLYFNNSSASPQTTSGSTDSAEQRMAYQGLLNALDGRGSALQAVDIWQWFMSGSNGSQWNIGVTPPLDQPNNGDLGLFLQQFAHTAVLPVAGDYNRDGVVDMRDYIVWRNEAGQSVLQYSDADGDGNGVVDTNDYAIWRAQFGQTAASGVSNAAVPEPATFVIALLAMVETSLVRTRRRSAA
ncbi:MAG TPA: hypothetical protein VH107_14160 [Lacipirellulaceae bacterium]|jgi:hypothetical protein|nr:hypothetical protein [Lacipirellulaceae bacterium]